MSGANQATATYLMGQTDAETERLLRQGQLFNPAMHRLLTEAGLEPGMRVLDLGSGAGDVALVAAAIVGPTGSVVGIDRNPALLAVARARAADWPTVSFLEADLHTVALAGQFDAIVGRLVLMYLPEPATVLRRLASLLRPGGIIACQEFNFTAASVQTYPAMPLWQRFWDWMQQTVVRAGAEPVMGYKLAATYQAAGLPVPRLRLESLLITGVEQAAYSWAADSLRSMLPLAFKLGITTAEEVDIDTLAERLRATTLAHGGVVKTPDLVSAWARLG